MSRREKLANEILENGQANQAGDDDKQEPTLEEQVGANAIK